MLESVITFCYALVCILLILAILLQHYKGDSQKGSSSYFGGSGSKDFLYQKTKLLIFLFFALAFTHTALKFNSFQKNQKNDLPPVITAPIQNKSEIQESITQKS